MTNSTPMISLLVPIYNVERYLEECLEAVRNQTLSDIEVLCINDGSTDSSREIIQKYLDSDSRFKVIDKENSGYGASMNMGLEAATGEYIGILESDDFFELDALEKLYKRASENDADVVKADFYLYWSQPIPKNEKFGWVNSDEDQVTTPQQFTEVFYRKPSIWSAIYKRSFLNENGIRFLETPGASYQDAGFNFKVWATAKTIVLESDAVLHYRQDNEASSVNSPGKVYCVCDEYAEMLRYLSERPELEKKLAPIVVKMRYDSYMWNYERLTESLQKEFILRMAKDFKHEDETGLTDYGLFKPEPWKIVDRREIMENPIAFHENQKIGSKPGKLNTIKRLYNKGGFGLVVKTAGKKLFK